MRGLLTLGATIFVAGWLVATSSAQQTPYDLIIRNAPNPRWHGQPVVPSRGGDA